jgi:hypothetical protein
MAGRKESDVRTTDHQGPAEACTEAAAAAVTLSAGRPIGAQQPRGVPVGRVVGADGASHGALVIAVQVRICRAGEAVQEAG